VIRRIWGAQSAVEGQVTASTESAAGFRDPKLPPSGHLLDVNGGKLFAAAFDPDHLQVTGRAVPMVEDIATALVSGTAQYAFSDTGVFAYRRARNPKRILAWMDSSGQMQPMRNGSAEYQEARFSRDGSRLLLTIGDGVQSDIWSYDIASDALKRLTFYADNDRSGIWSPDGRHFVYSSWQPDVGRFNPFLQSATSGGEPQRLTTSKNFQSPTDWDPSGKYIASRKREVAAPISCSCRSTLLRVASLTSKPRRS
jgi:hypothetical protein